MSNATQSPVPQVVNGVDRAVLFATLDLVNTQRELADFQFRVSNTWVDGTYSRTRFESFSGAGGEHEHKSEYALESDHPEVLTGADRGPTPVEIVLAALASCLTAGIGNIAAARGIKLDRVTSKIEGNIDLQGVFGLNDDVRNGFKNVKVSFEIEGDADPATLRALAEQSKKRSAVYDIITNGVPVEIEIRA
jgi:uncharacterized OsmC-like protein